MRIALLLIAIPLMASQSFILNSGRRVTIPGPATGPMKENITGFRADVQFESLNPAATERDVIRQDTSWALRWDASTGTLSTLILNTGGGPFITGLTGWVHIRTRVRRDPVAVAYTLEAWNEVTGERRSASIADPAPGSTTPFGGGVIYIGAQSPATAAEVAVGFLRIYSAPGALDAAPPVRLLTSSFADLLNLELEGNLLDSSGRGLNGSMSLGSAAYQTTTVLPPVVNVSGPVSVRATQPASFTGSCISNEDDPACTVRWNQVSGPVRGEFTNANTLTPTFRPPQHGEYGLVVGVSTGTQSSTTSVTLGASATDVNGVVVVPDANINAILGPIIRTGANPWNWYDTRDIYSGQFQIDQQTGVNGAPAFWTQNNWAFNLAGTITVTAGSNLINGVGTQFQTDFCGGPGRTVPNTFAQIYVKYTMAEYPGVLTIARPNIVTCNSQTQITIGQAWGWSTGTQTGLNYARGRWEMDTTALGAGTVSVTNGSATVTGTGTNFQALYCGGGSTPPIANPTPTIYIEYAPNAYPGRVEVFTGTVAACPSATSLTLTQTWLAATGTQSGLRYGGARSLDGWWTNTNTPGNYYDNVLAFYIMWYRTGLTKYRDAARNLARNWWEGPFYGRGKNYDTSAMGGTYIAAGPARGQSLTGLILWALESGENIWPGLIYVMDYQKSSGWDYMNTRGWDPALIGLGDLREQAYLVAAYALYARFAMISPGVPDTVRRQAYRQYVKDYINLLLEPFQFPTGEWRWLSVQNLSIAGTPFVTVTNGSTNVTLTGTTWGPSNFCVNDCDAGAYQAWLWFFTNRTNAELPGRQNSDLGGDPVIYKFTTVTSTTGTLDRPYEGTSGNKGMIASSLVGFGNQPFMQAIMVGALATYVYDTMVFYGDTAEATKARNMAALGAQWLRSSDAFRASDHYLYGGSLFLNCVANPTGTGCAGSTVLNGEGMKAISAVHLASPSTTTLNQGDEWYNAMWCKPTGGWLCPIPSYGVYADYIDDIGVSGSFMNNPRDPLTNKWFGFFFGYGGGASWPVARAGGLAPPDTRTVTLSFALPAGATAATVDYRAPSGAESTINCTVASSRASCALPTDWRQGNYQSRITVTLAEGQAVGDWQPLRVQ